ncbi:MAG TPA: MFS transporter [Candidatus Baltobacteraceae bacterium]|jgi:multidrug resistance protein|nr:MFS transporter [Candidatus Baltobacteraceae bacterium]
MIRKLLPILGITFIDIIGFSMLLPILPYFVTHFGMSAAVVGFLVATFSLCQLISGPIWGNVSDRIGRKAVLIISQIGATIGWAMLAFAGNIFWVFIARIVEGTSGGNIGITQAYVADLVEPKDRSRAFGLIGAMFAAGMVFGPVGGGALFARFGFEAPFLAASALQFLTLILTIVLLPESRSKAVDGEAHVGLRDIAATLRNPRLSRILWQKLALSLALYGWYASIALYLQGQLHFGVVTTTEYFSGFALVNVAINGFGIEKTSNKLGDRAMSTIGLCSLLTGFAIVPFAHNFWMVGIAMGFFALGGAFANNGITALISNAAAEREQGTVLGVSSSLDSLSGIIAPPISTGMLSKYGSPYAGVESFVLAAVALVMGIAAAPNDAKYLRNTAPLPEVSPET